jgi:CheY-like chemotaxis protein
MPRSTPNVILADLMMPDYNGIELIEELKRRQGCGARHHHDGAFVSQDGR